MNTGSIKATVKPAVRTKVVATIAVYAILALFSAVMAVYDIVTGKILFGLLFLLAAVIFVILLLIKGNTVFGTYIKLENGNLMLKSWRGDFLPYDMNGGFFSDLKPAKTKITSVPSEEVSLILVGTKDFVKRNATDAGKTLVKALYPYEHSSKKSKKSIISSIDLFYVETIDNESIFMCVEGYDPKEVVRIIEKTYEKNPKVKVKVNNREYRKYIKRIREDIPEKE